LELWLPFRTYLALQVLKKALGDVALIITVLNLSGGTGSGTSDFIVFGAKLPAPRLRLHWFVREAELIEEYSSVNS
jgi:hypothetical protein